MVEEVDQASVDVIKALFESDNGKEFFLEYLRENLRIKFTNRYTSRVNLEIYFGERVVTTSNFTIETQMIIHGT
jgi:hypothetical protein